MKLKSIDHFVITTKNLEECLHFYADVLGMDHQIHGNRHMLVFGNQKINLHTYAGEFSPYAVNAGYGCQDFCLIASGDIGEIKREIEDAGVEIIEGIVEQHGAVGLMDSIYMYDPDGNLVEIAVYRKPAQPTSNGCAGKDASF